MLHIFRGGKVVSSNGKKITFTKARIKQIAKTYNRLRASKSHEAPIVKGHPTDDAPAYGWIDKLVARGYDLFAIPKQIDPTFAKDVNIGKHKKISIGLYQPNSPHNPAPGEYTLQHVGFVPIPAIKGLEDPTFSGISDTLVLYFSENRMETLQAFKDAFGALLGSLGTEETPVDEMLLSTVMDTLTSLIEPLLSEGEEEAAGDDTTAEFSGINKSLDEKNKSLELRLAKTIETNVLSFCEDMLKSGRMTPAEKAGAVQLLTLTANTLEFSGASSALEVAMDSYRNRSAVIQFSEVSGPGTMGFSGIEIAKLSNGDIDTRQLTAQAQAIVAKNPNLSMDQVIATLCGA